MWNKIRSSQQDDGHAPVVNEAGEQIEDRQEGPADDRPPAEVDGFGQPGISEGRLSALIGSRAENTAPRRVGDLVQQVM